MIRWGRTRKGAKWHAVTVGDRATVLWCWALCGTPIPYETVAERWDPAPSERCAACSRKYRKAQEEERDGK